MHVAGTGPRPNPWSVEEEEMYIYLWLGVYNVIGLFSTDIAYLLPFPLYSTVVCDGAVVFSLQVTTT